MKVYATSDHTGYKEHVPYILSNWCYYDSLDGEALRDGEKLKITWNDGSTSIEKIVVKKTYEAGNDMGHEIQIPVTEAFVATDFRGGKASIKLIGAIVSAERVKKLR